MLDMVTIDHHTSLDASDSGIRHFAQGIHGQKGGCISEMLLDHERLLRGSSSAKPMSYRAAASSHKELCTTSASSTTLVSTYPWVAVTPIGA